MDSKLSAETTENLKKLVEYVNERNKRKASQIVSTISSNDWKNNKDWLQVVKKIIVKGF